MLFLWYPKCTTCQKAKKWLDDNHISYEARDIKADNPAPEEIKDWHELSGFPLKKFFNTSGLVYKELELKDKLPTISEEEQYQLLGSDGMLVKRPIIIDKDTVLIGFKEKDWSEFYGK
ncbi:arsenate reductase family protein [Anaerocolumna sp. AGMB13020]|uniref:arsenate reductase family protein n=1 Tax=Anaerocolumna sp. AGMB13020 TaxID=3081750 RepID=UPI002952D085|nr:arsenate reductase family protein [Anaerocolumna sp. AGMB13020]WOO37459.1 arsenate reductase family protein [Anaerocolumna sp. AGMB13020]